MDLAVRVTWEPGDAQRLVREALDAGYPTLIAGGGDGTLHEVAAAMLEIQADASLALLPLGSANDFAKAAGIPLDPVEALGLLEQPAQVIDIGEMNGHSFVNMATGGFGSKVTASTSEELKRVLGGGASSAHRPDALCRDSFREGAFQRAGLRLGRRVPALGIGNGRQAGGGQLLCPQATIDDGLLDVCIVPAPADAVGTLGTLLSGGLLGVDAVSVSARVPWLEVEAPTAININLDGEPFTGASLRFDVRPRALRFDVPPESPLLQRNLRAQ